MQENITLLERRVHSIVDRLRARAAERSRLEQELEVLRRRMDGIEARAAEEATEASRRTWSREIGATVETLREAVRSLRQE